FNSTRLWPKLDRPPRVFDSQQPTSTMRRACWRSQSRDIARAKRGSLKLRTRRINWSHCAPRSIKRFLITGLPRLNCGKRREDRSLAAESIENSENNNE